MQFFILAVSVAAATWVFVIRNPSHQPISSANTPSQQNQKGRGHVATRAFVLATGLALAVGLAGCGGSGSSSTASKSMPAVVGKQLDVALSEIKSAGFDGEVDVSGGGAFGVVNESNWQVCTQTPEAGGSLTGTPKLAVDRSCGGSSESATASTSSSAPPTTVADVTLTAANNPELAAILAVPSECSDSIQAFALKYAGRTLEFDGNIADMANHENKTTRYDFLISPGDFSTTSAVGPNFKFEDVNTFDLHLTGTNIPSYVGQGDNLHFVVRVEEFNKTQCLFFVEPISTSVR